jgi:hypothetical protein
VFLAVERKLKQMGCGEENSMIFASEVASDSLELTSYENQVYAEQFDGSLQTMITLQEGWYDGKMVSRMQVITLAAKIVGACTVFACTLYYVGAALTLVVLVVLALFRINLLASFCDWVQRLFRELSGGAVRLPQH